MKTNLNIVLLSSLLFVLSSSYLPCKGNANTEEYDRILSGTETPKPVDNIEHKYFPDLDGIWLLTKKTIRRRIDPQLIKPVVLRQCNSRLPFEKRDFKKNVVIHSLGPDYFTIRSLYPVTNDIYYDPNQDIDITYENFGLKGVLDPFDLSYAYTIKLKDHINYPSLARQLWLNGKLKYDSISRHKIVARGYEIEYTPECEGFLLDEIVLEFTKARPLDFGRDKLAGKNTETNEAIPYSALYNKDLDKLDTAKPKEEFKPAHFYKPLESLSGQKKAVKVPGMW